MEINKPSKCLITKLKIYSHRPSDWLISILFFSTEDSILSLFHIEHLTYRLSHLQIEHMFTQSFKLSHLRIEHLFTQNLHFRLSHLHIEHLFKQNSRSSYYYSEHLFIQTLRLSHFHIEQKLTKKRLVIFTKTLPSKSSLWWITYPHSRIRENLSSLLSMVSLGRSKSHL